MLLPEGKTPAYLGQAVAILIFQDFARFRFAKDKLQFNDAVIRYGAVTGPLQRDPWGTSRFVRVGGKTPYDEDVFSRLKDGLVVPPLTRSTSRSGRAGGERRTGAEGMSHADAIGNELHIRPPTGSC